ncbi:hypothetical protein BB560_002891 [Smittium megazygosporum]|uniref:Uncharacterized protein n=1 Tax=Smittium megazygosporum TaxID=133381 RepID=A0A2T9ZDM6_9FUNG|nr:hypothetical protein BB560_002891 [Smittium megazygosporum]
MSLSDLPVDNIEIRRYSIHRLAKLLRHPDDLQFKLDSIKSKLAQEKLLTDAQLNVDVQRQFDDVQEGLDLLASTKDQIEVSKVEMNEIDTLCKEAQGFLTNYDRIKKLEASLQNALDNFDKYEYNILVMHYNINELEKFQKQATQLTENCDDDVKQTLTDLFVDFVNVRDAFEKFLFKLFSKTYDLAAEQRYNMIIHLVKIVEAEERNDATILKEEASRKFLDSLSQSNNTQTSYSSSSSKKKIKLKKYKDVFFDTQKAIVKNRMAEFFNQVVQDEDQIDKTTDLVIDDMQFVSENIVPCVPRSYKLFDFYLEQYHLCVVEKVNSVVSQELDGRSILNVLRLTREYPVLLKRDLGVTKDKIVPSLLEGREDSLVAEYLGLVRSKITEWINNLMKTETKDFLERIEPPPTGESNHYILQGSIIMFEIVNQQIDLAMESNRGKLVCDVMSECNKLFSVVNNEWKSILDSQIIMQIERPNEIPEGLVEYMLALANDQLRCVEFAEGIQTRLIEQLNRIFQDKLSTEIGSAMEGFMDVAQKAVSGLSDIVLNDLRPVTTVLYTADWYREEMIEIVMETFEDYTSDFKTHMHEFLFIRLMQDILERFVAQCIEAIKFKNTRFITKTCTKKMKHAANRINAFFKDHLDQIIVSDAVNTYRAVISLIESSPNMIYLEFFSVKKTYHDIPFELVKDIISKREDITKSEAKNILESLAEKSGADQPAIGKRQTLFSKLSNY